MEIAHLDTASYLVQSKCLRGTDTLLALQLLTLAGNLTRFTLGLDNMERDTGLGSAVQTEDQHRFRGSGRLNFLVTLIEHSLDLTP